MRNWRWVFAIGAVVVYGFPAMAWASEVDALLGKLVEKGLLTSSEAQEVRNDMSQELAPSRDKERISFNGDMRVRNEYRDRTNTADVNRQRIRFRLGMKATVTDQLDADAAFDAFVDSDFGGGDTNHKGNVWYVTLATLKNSTATLKHFNADEVNGAKSHEGRLQVDWMTKF